MFWPTAPQMWAARVARAHESLCADWARRVPARVPPSLEVLVEEARRHPRLDLLGVIAKKRVELR